MTRIRFVLILTVTSIPLFAQESARDTAKAEPIIVTATRVPIGQRSLPVAATVISGAELRARGITTVADALRDVTSASVVQSGSAGSTTSLFLRGGESKHVKVLIDGIPSNDPGGSYDFASLTTDNIERIEIVRGPASVIYGADAVTGVVHIITRRGEGPPRADFELRSGIAPRERLSGADPDPVRTYDLSAGMRGASQSSSYSLVIGRHESTGLYELNNDYRNTTFSGHATLAPSRGTDLRVSLRYTDYQFSYPTNGGGDVVDSNAHRTEDRIAIGVEVERRLTSAASAQLALSSTVNDGGTDDALDQPGGTSFLSQDKVRRRGAELRLRFHPGSAVNGTIGVHLEQQDQRSQSQSEFGGAQFTSNFRAARRNQGVYGEVVLVPHHRVTAILGGRVDDNERFGTFGTWRAGVSLRPLTATRLRASAGTAFREPTFFEHYSTGFVTGNPELRPERSLSLDAGADQELFDGRARASVTVFAQRFRDMIDFSGSVGPCGFSYCNLVAATANGLEGEIGAQVFGPLSARAGVTLLHTEVTTAGVNDGCCGDLYQEGERLIRRPGHKWFGIVEHRGASRFSAAARVILVGQRNDRDFRVFPFQPVIVPGYQRTDVGAEYDLRDTRARSSLLLHVENLTDTRYQNAFNFLAPRRTISLGVRSTL